MVGNVFVLCGLLISSVVGQVSNRRRQESAAKVGRTSTVLTDLDELKRLSTAENSLRSKLRNFVDDQQQQLDRIRKLLEVCEDERRRAETVGDEGHLGNPTNAYRLVKRLAIDWQEAVKTIEQQSNKTTGFLKKLRSKTEMFPERADLLPVGRAIFRLQDTYELSAERVANGDLPVVDYSYDNVSAMTANDCYHLGLMAYAKNDYYHAVMWMQTTLKLLKNKPDKTVDKKLILDFLSHSLYEQGDVHGALKYTKKWLKLDASHSRALKNKERYERQLKEMQSSGKQSDPFVNSRKLDAFRSSEEFHNYERLCRGQQTQNSTKETDRLLSCRYVTYHPSFYLSPVKEEIVSLDPPISLFHDVISRQELDTVKQLAQSKLRSSKVVPNASFDSDKYDARSSRTAWLSDLDNIRIARLSRKASLLSNLTLDTAEDFQVLNYGIGGHYVTHNDFLKAKDVKEHAGNRIATFLCYLSNVRAGGATVFPNVGVSVSPEQGSCVLWNNLRSHGEGDIRSRHGSCPVLAGFKWAFNKWFHERGQEFTRPCVASDMMG